jgi:hypothetical protein
MVEFWAPCAQSLTQPAATLSYPVAQRAEKVFLRLLARMFHNLRSRRLEEADEARAGGDPPPHVGGYSLSEFRARCEISGLAGYPSVEAVC